MATLFDGYGAAHEAPRSRKGARPWDEMFPSFADLTAPRSAYKDIYGATIGHSSAHRSQRALGNPKQLCRLLGYPILHFRGPHPSHRAFGNSY